MPRPDPRAVPDDLAFDGHRPLLALYGLEATVRALLTAIVAIQSYEVLGSALLVSLLYAFNSIFGLITSLLLPLVFHRLGRRTTMTLGLCAGIGCGLALAWRSPGPLVVALMLQIVMNIVFEGVMSLTVMERLPRRHIGAFESKRLLLSGVAYTVGPWLGVALDRRVAADLTFYIVAALSLALLVIYWTRGPGANELVVEPKPVTAVPNPLRFVPRYAAQPRLVLAWLLAFGRSGWWIMFFVYGPIYVAQAGYPADLGGALVSIGLAPMLLMSLWARFARRLGLRTLLVCSFTAVALLTLAAGVTSAHPVPTMMLLILAAWCATVIDAAGNTPFLRAVHPYERAAMTSVFLTFRHATSLVSPGIFAITLWVLPLGAVFLVSGAMALGIAWLARHLPRQM